MTHQRFSKSEVDSVNRLVPYAEKKQFVAELFLNGYESNFTVSMRDVMRYAAGEPDTTYKNDVFTFLELMMRGVETHEIIGDKKLREIANRWNLYNDSEKE